MPSTAIAWSVYEGFKHVINNYSSTTATAQHPYDTLASEIRDRGGSAASGGGLSSAPGHAAGVGGLTKFAFFYNFFVLYSTLLHLPPLRFHCADGCWERTQDRCNWCIDSQTL